MKLLIICTALVTMVGCTTLTPVYDFYAHKHAVPMLGADYLTIPPPQEASQEVYKPAYKAAATKAIERIESHRKSINSPGITAAVAVDGELVWAGASGWPDIENQTPMTIQTQLRIGSTSKALNGVLLARMVDKKLLALDTKLKTFELGKLNDAWANITPRQLASHTAGLPHYKENTDWHGLYKSMALNSHYSNVDDSVMLFDNSRTLFAPGESFHYSSLGTVLLSAVMQEAATEPYQSAMLHQVIQPLALTDTLPEPRSEERKERAPNLSRFYWHTEDKGKVVTVWRDVDLSHRLAGGGFISTSVDLVKLGLGAMSPEFISPQTQQTFWTPQLLNSGETNEQHYAIGWRVRESDFGPELGTLFHANHGGVSRGAQSWLMVIPEYKMVVAVNINAKTDVFWDFGKVSYDLVKLFLAQRKKIISENVPLPNSHTS